MKREELNDLLVELQSIQRDCFNNNSVQVEIISANDDIPFVRITVFNDDAIVHDVALNGKSVDYRFITESFYLFIDKGEVQRKIATIKKFINHKGEWKE